MVLKYAAMFRFASAAQRGALLKTGESRFPVLAEMKRVEIKGISLASIILDETGDYP
jgi:hypothetical protein